MIGGFTLSPREKEILKLFDDARALSVGFERRFREDLIIASKRIGIPFPVLNICQAFGRAYPFSDKDFFLIKHISAALKNEPRYTPVTSLLVNEKYIADTYADAMAKYAALTPEYKTPCNIERLLSLGGEAVRFGAPRSYSKTDLAVFAGKDSTAKRTSCALSGYFPSAYENVYVREDAPRRISKKLYGCAAALIYTRNAEGSAELVDFIKQYVNSFNAVHAFACDPEQLFGRLMSLNTGFTINAGALPNVDVLPYMYEDYRAAIKTSLAFFGKEIFGSSVVVVIAPHSRMKKICNLAGANGFSCCQAITFKKDECVNLLSCGHIVSRLNLNMLRAIQNLIGATAEIATHHPEELVRTTNTEKIFENRTSAAYRAKISISDSPAPFHEAVYATVGLILSAVRDGFDLKNGEMKISPSISLSITDKRSLGEAVASILGIYRVETELCIADENPAVELSDGNSEAEICLIATQGKRNKRIDGIENVDPLIFSDLDENGLCSFEMLRDFAFGTRFPKITAESDE